VEVKGYSLRELIRLKRLRSFRSVRLGKEDLDEMNRILDLLIDYHTM